MIVDFSPGPRRTRITCTLSFSKTRRKCLGSSAIGRVSKMSGGEKSACCAWTGAAARKAKTNQRRVITFISKMHGGGHPCRLLLLLFIDAAFLGDANACALELAIDLGDFYRVHIGRLARLPLFERVLPLCDGFPYLALFEL